VAYPYVPGVSTWAGKGLRYLVVVAIGHSKHFPKKDLISEKIDFSV